MGLTAKAPTTRDVREWWTNAAGGRGVKRRRWLCFQSGGLGSSQGCLAEARLTLGLKSAAHFGAEETTPDAMPVKQLTRHGVSSEPDVGAGESFSRSCRSATFGLWGNLRARCPVVPGRCAPSTTGYLPANLRLAQTGGDDMCFAANFAKMRPGRKPHIYRLR